MIFVGHLKFVAKFSTHSQNSTLVAVCSATVSFVHVLFTRYLSLSDMITLEDVHKTSKLPSYYYEFESDQKTDDVYVVRKFNDPVDYPHHIKTLRISPKFVSTFILSGTDPVSQYEPEIYAIFLFAIETKNLQVAEMLRCYIPCTSENPHGAMCTTGSCEHLIRAISKAVCVKWYDYGILLYEQTYPAHNFHVACALRYLDPLSKVPAKDYEVLFKFACAVHSWEYVHKLLEFGVQPKRHKNIAIREAVKDNQVSLVEQLLQFPGVDPSCHNQICIRSACKNGNVEMVRMLIGLNTVCPEAENFECIRSAKKHGFIDIVAILMAYYEKHSIVLPESIE